MKILAGIGIGGVAAAAGVGFLLNSGRRQEQESNSLSYSGTISATSKSDSKGELVYYEDLCHTVDEIYSQTSGAILFGIILNRDKNPICSPTEGFMSDNFALFEMVVGREYHVDNWGGKFSAEQIFNKAIMGRKATLRKGELIDAGTHSYFLDKVEFIDK